MKWNLFKGQSQATKTGLCVTFIFAIVSIAAWGTGHFQMWPAVTALGFHVIWIAVAYRKRLSINKNGIEVEDDEEGDSK